MCFGICIEIDRENFRIEKNNCNFPKILASKKNIMGSLCNQPLPEGGLVIKRGRGEGPLSSTQIDGGFDGVWCSLFLFFFGAGLGLHLSLRKRLGFKLHQYQEVRLYLILSQA